MKILYCVEILQTAKRFFIKFIFILSMIFLSLILFTTSSSAKVQYFHQIDSNGKESYSGRYPISSTINNGLSCYRFTYNDYDRLISIEHISNGKLQKTHFFPFGKIIFEYNKSTERRLYYDDQNLPVSDMDGAYFSKLIYNHNKNTILETNYDKTGHLLMNKDGVTKYLLITDSTGIVIEKYFLDKNSDTIVSDDGQYHLLFKYDNRGNVIESINYDEDGLVSEGFDGIAVETNEYDRYGNLFQTKYFDSKRQLKINSKKGAAIIESGYDENGNLINLKCLGTDGIPLGSKFIPYPISDIKYDKYGNLVEWRFLDKDLQLRYKILFNFGDKIIERVHYKNDSQLEEDDTLGVAIIRNKYDENQNEVEKSFYGIDGNPKEDKISGAAIRKMIYDNKGNKIEESYYGADNSLKLSKSGYAFIRFHYFNRIHLKEVEYFGVDGKPIENISGFAKCVNYFDKNRKLIKKIYYNKNGEKVSEHDY